MRKERTKGKRSSVPRSKEAAGGKPESEFAVPYSANYVEEVSHTQSGSHGSELVRYPANPSFQRALNACYWEKCSVHVARIFSGPT